MGKMIGIDLGTTNSCLAIMEGGEPKVLVNEEGLRTTPSVVGFAKNGEKLVGQIAKRQAVTNPENTIFSSKRFIGRRFEEVKQEKELVPYKVVKKDNGDSAFEIQGKLVTPEEISGLILGKLKKVAEDYLGREVSEAVITVPAYFNDSQRQATKDAGKIAGLNVKRIINEPTAAALAYGLDKKKDQKIAVFDFGGGTFDISILEVGDNVVEVKATNGDTHLGGDNFDHKILEWLIEEFKKDQGIDLKKDKMALQRLKEAAEKAKIELSSRLETEINLPFVTADASGPKHLNLKLSRSEFERMVEDLVERSLRPCKKAIEDSKLKASEIDEVVLVGGSTRIPVIQEAVKKFFGKEPNKSVNPDEVVAIGAAVQGGVLTGDVKDILLLDVTPLSLGIETLGGVSTKLIERNTTIPTRKSQVFSTAADNQPSVDVHVLQGEREMAQDNKSLGRFELLGIPSSPRGVPQIEVTFDIDADGILNVSAKDLGTGKEQTIKITSKSGLNEEEINKMVKEAELHSEEDKKKKEKVSIRNELDGMVYQTEKLLKENSKDISEEEKKKIEEPLKTAKEMLFNQDKNPSLEELQAAKEVLTEANHKFSSILYEKNKNKASSEQKPSPSPTDSPTDHSKESKTEGKNSNSTNNDDVIEADYQDIK